MSDLIGQTLLNRYRVDALIGRGGMAEVYRAHDLHRGYPVALKLLREDLAEDREFVRRFRAEARALAQLAHANIVRFYDFAQDGPLAFLVMDYIPGTTLRRRLLEVNGPLPLSEVRAIVQQIGAALAYAHHEGVIHCDVKPGNIMLAPDGRALLSDFGVAKLADSATVTTLMPGTPAYMSPEKILGKPLDHRTDIYSFGIVLYEMVTGRWPFVGESTGEMTGSTRERVRWEHLSVSPPDPRQFNPTLPMTLARIILKALAKDPAQRWGTTQEMGTAFDAACTAWTGAEAKAATPAFPPSERAPEIEMPSAHPYVRQLTFAPLKRLVARTPARVWGVVTHRFPPDIRGWQVFDPNSRAIWARITADSPEFAPEYLPISRPKTTPREIGVTVLSEDYQTMVRAYTTGDWQKVIDQADVVSKDPMLTDNPHVYFYIAEAYRQQGRLSDALANYRTAIAKDGSFAPAYWGRALAEIAQNNVNDALKDFDGALKADPNFVPAYLDRAVFYAVNGNTRRALADLEQAKLLAPGNALVHANLSLVYADTGQPQPALEAAEQALAIDPGMALAYFARGRAQYALGQFEDADRDLSLSYLYVKNAPPLYPSLWQAWVTYHYGLGKAGVGDDETALRAFNEAIGLRSSFPHAYLARGQVYLRAGQYDLARSDFNTAIGQFQQSDADNPAILDAYLGNGQALLGLNRPDSALSNFQFVVRREPQHFEGQLGLGQSLLLTGKAEDSLAAFQAALDAAVADAQRARVYDWRAQAFEALGRAKDQVADLVALAKITDAPGGLVSTAVARLTEIGPLPTGTPLLSPTPALPLALVTPVGMVTVTPPPEAVAADIRFSRRDNCVVQGSLEYFDQLPKTIYAHFYYDNWLPGVQWSDVWLRNGEPVYVETGIWNGSTGGCGFTNYDNGKLWWPEGTYEVQIFVGERWLVSRRFFIVAATPLPTDTTLPPTSTRVP